jgi:hypothetical protein
MGRGIEEGINVSNSNDDDDVESDSDEMLTDDMDAIGQWDEWN